MAEVPTGVLGPYWFALAEMVPWPVAAELALLGDRVAAERLLPLGLLNAVVPAEELMAEAHRWAERFVALPPAHVQRTKALMTAMRVLPDRDMLARELETRRILSELDDSREAVEAWAERRAPRYTGQVRACGDGRTARRRPRPRLHVGDLGAAVLADPGRLRRRGDQGRVDPSPGRPALPRATARLRSGVDRAQRAVEQPEPQQAEHHAQHAPSRRRRPGVAAHRALRRRAGELQPRRARVVGIVVGRR